MKPKEGTSLLDSMLNIAQGVFKKRTEIQDVLSPKHEKKVKKVINLILNKSYNEASNKIKKYKSEGLNICEHPDFIKAVRDEFEKQSTSGPIISNVTEMIEYFGSDINLTDLIKPSLLIRGKDMGFDHGMNYIRALSELIDLTEIIAEVLQEWIKMFEHNMFHLSSGDKSKHLLSALAEIHKMNPNLEFAQIDRYHEAIIQVVRNFSDHSKKIWFYLNQYFESFGNKVHFWHVCEAIENMIYESDAKWMETTTQLRYILEFDRFLEKHSIPWFSYEKISEYRNQFWIEDPEYITEKILEELEFLFDGINNYICESVRKELNIKGDITDESDQFNAKIHDSVKAKQTEMTKVIYGVCSLEILDAFYNKNKNNPIINWIKPE